MRKVTRDHPVKVEEVQSARAAMQAAQPRDRATRLQYNYEELVGQPQAIRETLDRERHNIEALGQVIADRGSGRFYGIGCGDSWAVAQAVKATFELLLERPFDALQALEFTRFGNRFLAPADVVIGLSASGTTAETINGLQLARAAGALTVGVTNKRDTPFTRVPETLIIGHAMRRASFPTQASTVGLAALLALATAGARSQGINTDRVIELERWLDALPHLIEEVIQLATLPAQLMAERCINHFAFVFVAAGPGMAAAMFGAAKIREGCGEHAYVVGTEEFHHYRIAQPNSPIILIAPEDPAHSRAIDVARETKDRGAMLISIVSERETDVAAISDIVFRVPPVPQHLSALPYTIPLQLAAWHTAKAKLDAGRVPPGTQ